jgi:hypothetical protein
MQIVGHLTMDGGVLLNDSHAIANRYLSFGWFDSPANVLGLFAQRLSNAVKSCVSMIHESYLKV